jgi:hypothetical protein
MQDDVTRQGESAGAQCVNVSRYIRAYYTTHLGLNRLLARRPSWDAPRTKNGCFWTPKFWGKREIIFNYFPKYINLSEMK